jgi:hypothetical protein
MGLYRLKGTATYTEEVTVIDPRSKGEVAMSVFVHDQSGGMFAVDSSYLDQCFEDNEDPCIPDPLNQGQEVILHGL